jgi:hypothetical protein
VTRIGGYLHLIPEDYGMLHFQSGAPNPREFWHVAPSIMGPATGTDLCIGRNAFTILSRMNVDEITVDYVIVDTLRGWQGKPSLRLLRHGAMGTQSRFQK